MLLEPCPRCGSNHTAVKRTGRRCGAALGLTAGAASGAASAIYGARLGRMAGVIVGPVGGAFGLIAGAVLGALACGTAGCLTGVALGRVADDNLLGNRVCKTCDHIYFAPVMRPDDRQGNLFDQEELDPHDPNYPHPPFFLRGFPESPD